MISRCKEPGDRYVPTPFPFLERSGNTVSVQLQFSMLVHSQKKRRRRDLYFAVGHRKLSDIHYRSTCEPKNKKGKEKRAQYISQHHECCTRSLLHASEMMSPSRLASLRDRPAGRRTTGGGRRG